MFLSVFLPEGKKWMVNQFVKTENLTMLGEVENKVGCLFLYLHSLHA